MQFNSQRTYCEIESQRTAWVCLKYGNGHTIRLYANSYTLNEKLKDKCCIGTYANLLHHVYNYKGEKRRCKKGVIFCFTCVFDCWVDDEMVMITCQRQ